MKEGMHGTFSEHVADGQIEEAVPGLVSEIAHSYSRFQTETEIGVFLGRRSHISHCLHVDVITFVSSSYAVYHSLIFYINKRLLPYLTTVD